MADQQISSDEKTESKMTAPSVHTEPISGKTSTRPETSSNDDSDLEDNSNVSKFPLHRLFWFFFYNLGLFACGDPVAQIALIKEKLVIQDK